MKRGHAERVIKNSVQKTRIKLKVICISKMCFPFCPLDLENTLFHLVFDKLINKMDLSNCSSGKSFEREPAGRHCV